MRALLFLLSSSLSSAPALSLPPRAASGTPLPAASAPELTLERLFSDPPLDGRRPVQARLSPGGRFVSFLKASVDDSEILELWATPLPTGPSVRLVTVSDLLGGASEKRTEAEKMALERKRISQRGITSYSWCGNDDDTLLFPLSGDLFIARLTAHGPVTRRLTHDDDTPEREPVCRRDGGAVAYVKNGNVVVQDVNTGRTRTVTQGASATRFFGLADFIASEELGRFEGMWWSGDGRRLLVLVVDESGVGEKTRAQIFSDRTDLFSQRYPAAGEKNAVVTALLIDLQQGRTTPLALPKDAEYVARGGFFQDGMPWLEVLTRDQKKLTLLEYEPRQGRGRVVLEETDEAWVETHDDLVELPAFALSGQAALLWSSERSGSKQLVLVDRKTGARTPLTRQPEPIDSVVCTDGRRVVFAGLTERGRTTDLFVVDATDPSPTAEALPGRHEHTSRSAVADRACRRLLLTASSFGTPPTTTVVSLDAESEPPVAVPSDPPDPRLSSWVTPPQVVDVVAADGSTPLNAFYLPPWTTTTSSGQVPVIVHAYGGPTGSVVGHRWSRQWGVFAHWRQRGFGVFLVDTRGMAHRDRAFTRAHHHAFGKVEIEDLFAAVRQLPAQVPSVDAQRLGFFGWSYGGTVAARAVLDESSPFAAAVAVAPVTDWTLYDTAYTERYLGLPTLPDGSPSPSYTRANLILRAARLSRPLLLVHGTADDNVLFEHSLRLMEALQNEGKLFATSIYPGKAHGIAGKKAQRHVYETTTAFFVDHLLGQPSEPQKTPRQ
jgi:dipeptidyl-peptidase-4